MQKKIVIVGGVAAGASAAARMRRMDEHAKIVMLERGDFISFANCGLPYYIGGVIAQRDSLFVQTPAAMKKRFALDIRTKNEVIAIDASAKTITIYDHNLGILYTEFYDYLLLCNGASPIIPELSGIDKQNVFLVRNIPDTDAIKEYVLRSSSQTAVIIGGGLIGLEMAEMIRHIGLNVHIVEASSQVLPPLDQEMAAYVHKELRNQGIDLHLQDKADSLLYDNDFVTHVQLASGKSISADLVILGIGVKPNSSIAREAGLRIGNLGGIEVDEFLRTSDPSIFAAGDVIQVKNLISGSDALFPLAGPANRQGWIAANNIVGPKMISYKGVQGTSIVKVFDQTAATTGLNEKTLKAMGIPYQAIHVHPNSSASYYPGAAQMTIKILFDPEDGRLLGAQIIGARGVDKRIDVFAAALRLKQNVFDIQEFELAYAPPYSSAKDPVNLAAYAAGNVVTKQVDLIHWDSISSYIDNNDAILIDARTAREYSLGSVPGAINIPVDELRSRYEELPKDKDLLVYCQVGLRSYIACRILSQLGFKVKNISGGYNLYTVINQY